MFFFQKIVLLLIRSEIEIWLTSGGEVGSLSHYLRQVLKKPFQVGGWEWDFGIINRTDLDQYLGFWKLYTFGHLFGS